LHPRCILPARQYGIPLHVYATQAPDLEGTVLSAEGSDGRAQVKAVCTKKGITLVSLESPGMWHQVGFLADAFQVFKQHGLSVDLVSTSETNVTVSLDPAANALDNACVADLVADLARLCRVQVIGPCASVSLVGRNIRAILHQLGGAFEFFEEQKIYLVSQAANDLNFTFVVDENQGDRLVTQLHELLIRPVPGDKVLGPTWQQLFSRPPSSSAGATPWWRVRREALLEALGDKDAAFVYDLGVARVTARSLCTLGSLARVHYSMKANPHPQLLRALHEEGIEFECVSRGEVERVLELFPALERERILYTPNFAPRAEYAWALAAGVRVTVDNSDVLAAWPQLFAGREIFVRVDPGVGRGHHEHVRTAGSRSKFGIPVTELGEAARLARACGAHVIGLQAHIGSGIFDITSWEHTARLLAAAAADFPGVRVIDVGGGLGVPERAEQPGVDLVGLDTLLTAVRAGHPQLEVWLEPGRYLAATAAAWPDADRDSLVDQVLAVLEDPRFAAVFAPGSRAEIDVAGTLPGGAAGIAVSGRIDRLAVTGDRVLIVDYKTNRPPPLRLADVPPAYVIQLALYRQLLAQLYPSRAVDAAILWTDLPALMEIPSSTLERSLATMPKM